tara:strand:+ start:532 stop:1380 length:849 start_codon:yes stop_codon:yes gene_type:complete
VIDLIAEWAPSIVVGLDPLSMIALAAIVMIGLPHGAFDGAVAIALGYGNTLKSMLGFILGYIAIAASVVAFWLIFSDIALILFLIISVFHFGIGDSQSGKWLMRTTQIIAHGGLVVVGISILHRSEVELIFIHLVGSETALLWQFLDMASFGLIAILIMYLVQAFLLPSIRIRFFELVGLGFAYYFLPPLVGFALYFCAVHSVRHLRYTWVKLRLRAYGVRTLVLLACFFTAISWIAGISIFWQMPNTETIDGAILRVIFIGLAALTVPHMLLVDGIFRRVS